ncbi:MAG: ABC transporter permease, partial [Proteobacteria bacterium]|nr:ABC transporter permease [Pseudomonadota bacterium]
IDPVLKIKLTSGTGLSRLETLTADAQLTRLGYVLKNKKFISLISTKRAVGQDVLTTVSNRLRGKNALVLPWVHPLEIQLGEDITLLAFALPKADGLTVPWAQELPMGPDWRQIILPEDIRLTPDSLLTLVKEDRINIPVTQNNTIFSPGQFALIPPQLAGILNLSLRRNISWLPQADQFILKRRGYAAFRMYANTLDDVEPLKLQMEAQDIPVHTEAERIRDIRELDKHLGMIFWLIALGGLLGGAGSLMASLYASVERKRRDLGVLGLIGFTRGSLLCFPLYQAFFLTLGGWILALGFYTGMAALINRLFSSQLSTGESLCRMNFDHLAYAAAGVILLGQLAAALAARRVISIDPAEALRDE